MRVLKKYDEKEINGMNRMERIFNQMMENDEKILVSYFPLCDTALADQVGWAGKYFDNGTTVLEMGLPYEDPCLDGKTVRDSMERALVDNTVEDAFEVIKNLRKAYPDNILQVMSYFEILEKIGLDEFAAKCNEAGVDAVLTPNIAPDRVPELDAALGKFNIIHLRFAPFTLTDEVIEDLKKNAKGYIFQQAVDGATGPQDKTSPQVGVNVKLLKELGVKTPVVAGFGISNQQQVGEMKDMGVDGVIVGSSILTSIVAGNGADFIKSLRGALE